MNEKTIKTLNEEYRKKIDKEEAFEDAKIRLSGIKVKDLNEKIPREKIIKFENDIIFEILPVLEDKKKLLKERIKKDENKLLNIKEDPDYALLIETSINKDKEQIQEIDKEIEKYQDILNKLKK